MFKFNAASFVQLSSYLKEIQERPEKWNLNGNNRTAARSAFERVKNQCLEIGLELSAAQCDRVIKHIDSPESASIHLQPVCAELENRIQDELTNLLFIGLNKSEQALYAPKTPLFGQRVFDRFPSAIVEIEAAGKCLAVGQGTATVFHLMRIMEIGLRRLAKSLSIPYAPSWESYLKQISDKVASKHKTKGIKWKKR